MRGSATIRKDAYAKDDRGGVLHCLEHYLEDDDRRYGVEHEGEGVPFEYTCAYLLGVDGRPFLDDLLSRTAGTVLDRFSNQDADVVLIVAREKGRLIVEDDQRNEIFDLFR